MVNSPTPWTITMHGADYHVCDANGELLMTDESYYPVALSLEDAKMVVELVNTPPPATPVAIQRLIDEVKVDEKPYTGGYNRTYHRHNR